MGGTYDKNWCPIHGLQTSAYKGCCLICLPKMTHLKKTPKRCCRTCDNFIPRGRILKAAREEQRVHEIADEDLEEMAKELTKADRHVKGICVEGGYTEIGDPDLERDPKDEWYCTGWRRGGHPLD